MSKGREVGLSSGLDEMQAASLQRRRHLKAQQDRADGVQPLGVTGSATTWLDMPGCFSDFQGELLLALLKP